MVADLNSSQRASATVWLAFDDAWNFEESQSFDAPFRVDALDVGPLLRFITTKREVESFLCEIRQVF